MTLKQILENKLINYSEIAKKLGISPTAFYYKLNQKNYNKFTANQEKEIFIIFEKLIIDLRKYIDKKTIKKSFSNIHL